MSEPQVKEVSDSDLQEVKSRMKLIADADPTQYHNDFSLKRYIRAFKTVDDAFKVWNEDRRQMITLMIVICFVSQAILKTNKWRVEYGIKDLTPETPCIKKNLEMKKARVLKHRDMYGRPVIYIPARNHNVNDRDIDELTKFIVYCLVSKSITKMAAKSSLYPLLGQV